DFTPSAEVLEPDPQSQVSDPNPDPAGSAAIDPGSVSGNPHEGKQPIPLNLSPDKDKPVLSTNGQKVMFIYHSHNRESWLPEMKYTGTKELKDAFDPKINVTLLGKRLAVKLEDLGIGASNSEKDYPSVVNKYNFNFSYKYSLKTVQEAFAANPKLEYYFDIHRDSQKRELTTVKINGVDYAQLFLIVGLKNKNWEKNKQFADKINEKLDKKYPGISRGTYNKPSNSGNAEYNQSFSPNSILIEVGGPENTLVESYRTIDALAGVISEIYWDAEKVDAPVNLTKAN
ncbi:MAG TPA: stage II sporulation protein P, partial [Bacilli bacterium]